MPSRTCSGSARRRGGRAAALGGALLGLSLAAAALPGMARAEPDLADLALAWPLGDFRSPLVCDFPEGPRRGLRRVLVTPLRDYAHRKSDRVTLFDLEAEGASRCYSALSPEEPNLIGSLRITVTARSRPDTAQRDFDALLRRENGVRFAILEGRLRRSRIGAPESQPEILELAGGEAHFARLRAGSDYARLLAEFGPRRKLILTLEAPGGERLVLPLVELPRPARQ